MSRIIAGLAVVCVVIAVVLVYIFQGETDKAHTFGHNTAALASNDDRPRDDTAILGRISDRIAPPSSISGTSLAVEAPPIGTDWHKVLDELKPLAALGDREAAKRLYKDTLACRAYLGLADAIDSGLIAATPSSTTGQAVQARMEERLDRYAALLDRYSSVCASVSANNIDAQLPDVVLAAAQAGIADAVGCYLSGGFADLADYPRGELERIRASYSQHAMTVAARGLREGNWAVVDLLASAYSEQGPDLHYRGWLAGLVKPDALNRYALLELMSRGMVGQERVQMQQLLVNIAARHHLGPKVRNRADAWVDRIYGQYFVDRPYRGSQSYCNYELR